MSDNMNWRNFNKSAGDLGLQIGEEIFWVSRRQMADLSPVFESMLYGEFQESKKEIVPLSGKQPGDILEMLRCLFPTIGQGLKPIDDENIDLLLQLADEYQIKTLLDKCSDFLEQKIAANLVIEEIAELITKANQFHLKVAVLAGLKKLSKFDPSNLHREQAFNDLPLKMQLGVLSIAVYRPRPPPGHNYVVCLFYHAYIKCDHCNDEACHLQTCVKHRWTGDKKPECKRICQSCKTEYGSADVEFVCKCVDHLIEAQLKKYDF